MTRIHFEGIARGDTTVVGPLSRPDIVMIVMIDVSRQRTRVRVVNSLHGATAKAGGTSPPIFDAILLAVMIVILSIVLITVVMMLEDTVLMRTDMATFSCVIGNRNELMGDVGPLRSIGMGRQILRISRSGYGTTVQAARHAHRRRT
jgi:hypothetical protein